MPHPMDNIHGFEQHKAAYELAETILLNELVCDQWSLGTKLFRETLAEPEVRYTLFIMAATRLLPCSTS